MTIIKTFGRYTIYAPYTEEQFLTYDNESVLIQRVIDIIQKSEDIHIKNYNDTVYLKDYFYGDQDIYRDKRKLTRPEIDNKTVENWAYSIIDFRTTYLLGKPIQYVQLDDASEQEISTLNKYVRYENKKAKDMLLYQDVLVCGRGFRYVNKDATKQADEAPFEIINCDPENTEVIYSNSLGKKQLFAYIKTSMEYVPSDINNKGQEEVDPKPYDEYTIYTRNATFKINNLSGTLQLVEKSFQPLPSGEHLITEYYLNEKRIGLIELGKDLLNDINYLESLDKDDMEQFVNAIMVFTNAQVSAEDLAGIREMGAVCINSTDQKKASIDLLQGRLNATDTQTYYNRLLTAVHQILAVPIASDSGYITSGDTGKAKLTGQGYTSSGIRSEGAEAMFGMCDLNSLKTILAICKDVPNSNIKDLKVSNIDVRFQRDMSDNLLVKTQSLQTLYECDIPRKFANSIVNLFGDPAAVTEEQERMFGAQISKQNQGSSNQNAVNEQNNKVQDIQEKNNQGQ